MSLSTCSNKFNHLCSGTYLKHFPLVCFIQTLSLLLLVVHKVSRPTFHGYIYTFYFDNEHLYRFSPCRIFMVAGHLGTFGAPLNVRHFFSKFDSEYFSLIIFFEIFIYFGINNDFFHHNDTFRKK